MQGMDAWLAFWCDGPPERRYRWSHRGEARTVDEPEDKEDQEAIADMSPGAHVAANRGSLDAQSFKDDLIAGFAEASGHWFWEMDENLRFVWFSKNVEAHVRFPREWHYGKTRDEIGAPDVPKEIWEAHLETLRQHKPFKDFVYRRAGPDGEKWLTASGTPVFGGDGRFRGYRGTGGDVTALMLARREAERNAELIEHAVDGMNELFILCDTEDRIVMFNQRFREVNASVIDRVKPGMKFAQFVRLIIAEGLTPESADREEEYFRERMRFHESPGQSFVTRRDDNRWLLVRDQRTRDGGTIVVSADITEQVEAEQRLRDAMEQVQFANRAKTEFLANMSHELRTPLNSIIGFSDILASQMFGPLGHDRYVQYAENVNRAGQHLLDLIGDILDVSRIEAGEIHLDEEDFDVVPLINDCRLIVQPRALERDVVLNIKLAEKLGLIRADPLRIKQVLINLIANAIKFSDGGGRVEIHVDGGGHDPIRFTVRDDGIGIPEHDIPRVVEPFFQVMDARLAKHEGTGLGLTLAKAFAERHGGSLLIESELGVGTCVCVELPASRNVTS
jgi:signal transduction histidine kinase